MHEVVSGEVQGLMLGFSGNEVRVKAHHGFGSGSIIDTPESHENGLDAGFLERGLESDDAVLRYDPGCSVAGGKHHHGTVAHIELRYLGTIEQTVIQGDAQWFALRRNCHERSFAAKTAGSTGKEQTGSGTLVVVRN